MALNLEAVRRLARSEGLEEVFYNEQSRVVSFSKTSFQGDFIRINVYYTTGTVGTCVNHPRQGRTQLFRRNVTMEGLQTIFRTPRVHTGSGYHRTSPEPKRRRVLVDEEALDEETAAKEQLEFLKQEATRLAEERKNVKDQMVEAQTILDFFEAKRRAKAEAKKQVKMEAKREERGRYLDFCLTDSNHVSEIFDKTVTCIACGGDGTIMLYENGGWACSSGITKHLYNKLNGRQNSLPGPNYVAAGSQDRYYIRFADGKSEWVGCDEMTKTIILQSNCFCSIWFRLGFLLYCL